MSKTDYLGVSRYSRSIEAEIIVGYNDAQEDESFLLDMAWHILALIKLRGYSSLFCPVSATESWDIIN